MGRAVAHLDLDTFFVSCERLNNPKFNEVPLIVGGGHRGVVASCSYEARKFGVRSAMPMKLALQKCSHAIVVKGDMEFYSKKSHEVTQILAEMVPILEKASIDEFYMDLTGMDRFFGTYKWTNELAAKVIRETGLPLSFALSVNKTVSKIATGVGKPYGNLEVAENNVRQFLNPLLVGKIPGIGHTTSNLLSRIGVRTIKTLAEMPIELLQQFIGKNGIDLSNKANGIDLSPVQPYRDRKSLSKEHTFHQDTIDIPRLKALMVGMVEQLCYDLRREKWLTSVVTIKVRYANFDTHTRQKHVAYTSSDHSLTTTVHSLFDQLYDRRMRLRLIGVQFGGLVHGVYQPDLFKDEHKELAIYQAMDKIRDRFGKDAVARCAGASFMNKKL
ncbi:DNA polymerase IV [Pedobacter xixiisoli]|uniref:DNA polymerase IV n=1 Tax=Pedobacter xixiisoli TaxID=1476464 RepID=A0A286A7D8_9SPHI|nr:DNA polymerase IV [Pedobacter xixiisoli]SOD17787.1 DNA polymerase-4 [Pedobacter xixiisoli]